MEMYEQTEFAFAEEFKSPFDKLWEARLQGYRGSAAMFFNSLKLPVVREAYVKASELNYTL